MCLQQTTGSRYPTPHPMSSSCRRSRRSGKDLNAHHQAATRYQPTLTCCRRNVLRCMHNTCADARSYRCGCRVAPRRVWSGSYPNHFARRASCWHPRAYVSRSVHTPTMLYALFAAVARAIFFEQSSTVATRLRVLGSGLV